MQGIYIYRLHLFSLDMQQSEQLQRAGHIVESGADNNHARGIRLPWPLHTPSHQYPRMAFLLVILLLVIATNSLLMKMHESCSRGGLWHVIDEAASPRKSGSNTFKIFTRVHHQYTTQEVARLFHMDRTCRPQVKENKSWLSKTGNQVCMQSF